MKTITEDYCSFEIAKLLKEKGFDIPCWNYYDTIGNFTNGCLSNHNFQTSDTSAPTQSMAMKWLRKVHNIHISVYPFNRELPITENTSYTCDVATKKDSPMKGHLRGTWKTYEAAADAAIKYALEHELPQLTNNLN